jgi:predicted ArsR family transcriptional regulator
MNTIHDSSTRRVILTLLKTKALLTVNELSKLLQISEMAVRRHLNTLERDGLVQSILLRQTMGRPTNQYSLTELADDLFPKNYHQLTLDLLGELELEEKDLVGLLFERRKDKLFRKYEPLIQGKSLKDKVAQLAELQDAGGYMVQWSEEEDHYRLEEYNCPIAQVAGKYNQACQCELQLFEDLLNAPVERTECLAKSGNKCVYIIRSN